METESVGTDADAGSPIPRWFLKTLTHVHMFLHRLSGGRGFNNLSGTEICFVTMTGAKSGRRITRPLAWIPYRDGALLVASQGGAPEHPAWYHNLVAHPDIEITQRGERLALRARLASADEKPALWPLCDARWADFATYRKRTTRDIPIFVCEPRSG